MQLLRLLSILLLDRAILLNYNSHPQLLRMIQPTVPPLSVRSVPAPVLMGSATTIQSFRVLAILSFHDYHRFIP